MRYVAVFVLLFSFATCCFAQDDQPIINPDPRELDGILNYKPVLPNIETSPLEVPPSFTITRYGMAQRFRDHLEEWRVYQEDRLNPLRATNMV
jgi:hypothetical protein